MLNAAEDLLSRPRVLAREWTKHKPHLAKSTSLPALHLVPHNRPLFTCKACGFANAYIPICLWCSWSSPDAVAVYERAVARVRRRRASGPGPAPAASRRYTTARRRSDGHDKARNLDGEHRPIAASRPSSAQFVKSASHRCATARSSQQSTARYRSSDSNTADDGVVAHVTKETENIPMFDSALEAGVLSGRVNNSTYVRTRRRRLPRPPLSTTTTTTIASFSSSHSLAASSDCHDVPPSAWHGMQLEFSSVGSNVPTRSSSMRSRNRSVTVSIPAPSPPPPPRRRVAPASAEIPSSGASKMRKRSSQSLRERKSGAKDFDATPAARRVKGSAPPSGAPSRDTSRSSSPEPRLGHPSRPYYTAIRKNMSRPTTPYSSTTSSSPPPVSYMPLRQSIEHHSPPKADIPLTRPSMDYSSRSSDHAHARPSGEWLALPPRRTGVGGSVSGEIELHMALAQRRSEDAPTHMRQEYVFRETRPAPLPRRGMRGHFRRLSEGIKSLFGTAKR